MHCTVTTASMRMHRPTCLSYAGARVAGSGRRWQAILQATQICLNKLARTLKDSQRMRVSRLIRGQPVPQLGRGEGFLELAYWMLEDEPCLEVAPNMTRGGEAE